MIKKVNNKKFIIKTGDITTEETDVIVCWTTPTLASGDETFVKIHKEAGSVLYEECLHSLMKYGKQKSFDVQHEIAVGSNIITNAGMLPAYNIVHSVLPNYRIKSQYNNRLPILIAGVKLSLELVKAYGDSRVPLHAVTFPPVSEKIYGTVDKKTIEDFFKVLLDTEGLKKFTIICETEELTEQYSKIFARLTSTMVERWLNRIFKTEY